MISYTAFYLQFFPVKTCTSTQISNRKTLIPAIPFPSSNLILPLNLKFLIASYLVAFSFSSDCFRYVVVPLISELIHPHLERLTTRLDNQYISINFWSCSLLQKFSISWLQFVQKFQCRKSVILLFEIIFLIIVIFDFLM